MTFPGNLVLLVAALCFVCNFSYATDYFYIYESEYWAKIATASLFKRDPNERLENSLNRGAGPQLNEISGEYHTDQYHLFSMIFYRALKDPRRTLDPSKATSFIIPYDFASDCAYYKNCAKSHGVCFDFRKCPLAPSVEALLKSSPWYKRNQGSDHLLIVGMNYAMDHYILKPNCKSLLSGTCRNCTKFAIDDYSFMYSGDAGILARGDNWHAIPFPSNFHWTKKVQKPFPWENTDRKVLVSYVGSGKSFYGPARRLRGSLIHYCSLHEELCVHHSYGLNGTRFSFNVAGHRPLQISQQSVFCFQPIGDLMTRKGLFDSLLLGCIPVVFDALTASAMYTWHWEESFWKEVSVELPFHPVAFRYFDPVEALTKMYTEEREKVARKQELIRRRVFELHYALDGRNDTFHFNSALPFTTLLPDSSGETGKEAIDKVIYNTKVSLDPYDSKPPDTWPLDPQTHEPVRDAYEICMELMLGWHSGRLKDFRNATVPECWDGWLDKELNRCRPGKEPNKGGKH